MAALYTMPPLPFQKFRECIPKRKETADYTVAGAEIYTNVQCWCENEVTKSMRDRNCCDTSEFSAFCSLDCAPDCDSPEARECIEKCPAVCYVGEDAPAGCSKKDCDACLSMTKCIFEDAQKDPEMKVCHTGGFLHSDQYKSFVAQSQQWSHRSAWLHANAMEYSACSADVATAAEENYCCGPESRIRDLCRACEPVVCDSPESVKCHERCAEICPELASPTEQCLSECIRSSGQCSKFLACKPQVKPTFEYMCFEGPPKANGCCENSCPLLCKRRLVQQVSSAGHVECDCGDCPLTEEDKVARVDELFDADLHKLTKTALIEIAYEMGLSTVTEEMRQMADAHVLAIKKIILEGHPAHASQIDAANHNFFAALLDEARLAKEHQDNNEYVQSPLSNEPAVIVGVKGPADEDKDPVLIVALVAVVIGILVTLVVIYFTRYRRPKPQSHTITTNAPIVVGNPVAGPAAAQPYQGTPIPVKEKASSDDKGS